MHKCFKYGELIVPGYWTYPSIFNIMNDKNKPINTGDVFMLNLYDALEYYKKFCKENNIMYFVVDTYPEKYGNIYNTKTYNEIRRVMYNQAFAKFEVTKIDIWYVYAKLMYKTYEYGYKNHKCDDNISVNVIKDFEIKIPVYHFVTRARKCKSGMVGDSFTCYQKNTKTFCIKQGVVPVRFRMDPIVSEKHEWPSFGMKYWNYGMSKNGLHYGSFKRSYDEQLIDYSDDSITIMFSDSRAKKRFHDCNSYERRKIHHKSWKECTKKRKQWM